MGPPGPGSGCCRLLRCSFSCPGALLGNRADDRLPQSDGADYLTARHAEIYDRHSRHSVVWWLWFFP
ncbi:predicted protein [Streptomyces albidoflavus]|nr:predicted protein [Streptomyces albidoflavus]